MIGHIHYVCKSLKKSYSMILNEKIHFQCAQQIYHVSHDNYDPRNGLQKLVSLKSYNDEIAESTPIPMRMSSQGSLHALVFGAWNVDHLDWKHREE